MKETICQILYVIIIYIKFKSFLNHESTYLFVLLEQEPLNVITPEIPTDNGVTKEFDPLRNSKEEQSKTPQASLVKCKWFILYNL